jgi:hypothetical protein
MEHRGPMEFCIDDSTVSYCLTGESMQLINLHEFKIHYNTIFIILHKTLITSLHYYRLTFYVKSAT